MKRVKIFPLPNSRRGSGGERPAVSWAQLINGGAHPSPFAALSFLDSKKIPIYRWVDKEIFPVDACRSQASSSRPYGDFCIITEPL